MPYRFATERRDYSDYAGGRVFYSVPGQPAFPVRLASEILQRCLAYRDSGAPCVVYDPCCGGAYHLSVLGYEHGAHIAAIVASDVNTAVLPLAKRNLGLLTAQGLSQRLAELQQLYETYQKSAHAEALASARRLQAKVPDIPTYVFATDVMDAAAIRAGLNGRSPDIVFSDIPYGSLTSWQSEVENKDPIWHMLTSLRSVLAPQAVVAIASDKGQKVMHEGYERLTHFQLGKRRVWLGRPLPL